MTSIHKGQTILFMIACHERKHALVARSTSIMTVERLRVRLFEMPIAGALPLRQAL